MKNCPHCSRPLSVSPQVQLDQKIEQLRVQCTDQGFVVTWDHYVTTRIAGALLSRSPGTISNWRYQDQPLPSRELHGRIEYSLIGIAQMLIDAENTFD